MVHSHSEPQSTTRTSESRTLCNQCEALKLVLEIEVRESLDPRLARELYNFNYLGPLDFNPTTYLNYGEVTEWTVDGPKDGVILHSHVFRLYHPSRTKCPCCDHLRGVLRILVEKLEKRGEYYVDLVFKPQHNIGDWDNHFSAEIHDLSARLKIGRVGSDNRPGIFSPLSSTQINFDLAKAALYECLNSCNIRQRMAPEEQGFITSFIDVESSCLVQSTLDESYA